VKIAIMHAMVLAGVLQAQESGRSVNDLSWLRGCWSAVKGQRVYEELWMGPAGETILGVSRNVRQDTTREFEFLRIHSDTHGAIFYTAKPSGQSEASFRLVSLDANRAVFENPDHDFPQRIIYTRIADSLVARIEGNVNGNTRGVDFRMRRTPCE
jgi:hypothetical protein